MSPLPEVRVVVLKRAPKPHQVLCTEFQPSWMTLHSGRAAGHAVLPSFLWDHVSGCGHPLCPPASAHCSSTVSFLLAGRPETPPQFYWSFCSTALKCFFTWIRNVL